MKKNNKPVVMNFGLLLPRECTTMSPQHCSSNRYYGEMGWLQLAIDIF